MRCQSDHISARITLKKSALVAAEASIDRPSGTPIAFNSEYWMMPLRTAEYDISITDAMLHGDFVSPIILQLVGGHALRMHKQHVRPEQIILAHEVDQVLGPAMDRGLQAKLAHGFKLRAEQLDRN